MSTKRADTTFMSIVLCLIVGLGLAIFFKGDGLIGVVVFGLVLALVFGWAG